MRMHRPVSGSWSGYICFPMVSHPTYAVPPPRFLVDLPDPADVPRSCEVIFFQNSMIHAVTCRGRAFLAQVVFSRVQQAAAPARTQLHLITVYPDRGMVRPQQGEPPMCAPRTASAAGYILLSTTSSSPVGHRKSARSSRCLPTCLRGAAQNTTQFTCQAPPWWPATRGARGRSPLCRCRWTAPARSSWATEWPAPR